jgi:glucokinase
MKGCYEAYAGGAAVAARVKEEIVNHPDSIINNLCNNDIDSIDMLVIEKAVRANDPYAMSIWEEMSIANAQAFGMFINTLNPDKIVMGTLAWAIGDLYIDPIKKYLPEYCWKEALANCELVCSKLQREISSYAGLAAALNYVKEKNI